MHFNSNKDKGIEAIDLHGQQVKFALKLLEERIDTITSKHKGKIGNLAVCRRTAHSSVENQISRNCP